MFNQWLKKVLKLKKKNSSLIKVLIIEDNPVDVKMIEKAVHACGHNSLIAYDGRSGIAMAIEHKPNLIILDYGLPDINGAKVLDEIRSMKETSSEAVMVLTVLTDPSVVLDSFEHGADQYFKKPISVSYLTRQIQVMLRQPHKN